MFFDNLAKIEEISRGCGTVIFVLPEKENVTIKNAFVLKPEGKATITIEQVREVLSQLSTKQTEDRFILIRPADKLGEEAENAILKSLEEPKEHVHFVLVTEHLSRLLPTILSRAMIYIYRDGKKSMTEIAADEKTKDLAKRLLTAKPADLVGLVEEITKKKDGVRERTLDILSVAVEMAYKSYFITGNMNFLKKIPKLIAAHENISKNGHIKLQLVANLI